MKPVRRSIYISGKLREILDQSGSRCFSGNLARIATQHDRMAALTRPAFNREQWERLLPVLDRGATTDDWNLLPAIYSTAAPNDLGLIKLLSGLTEVQRISLQITLESWRNADDKETLLDWISL